ncbi:MAG TPA: T3SS effector HopA1 family protein [Jatrophihabitans sp.]|nr:T3SS effector HopA1 family protein [Jatrophihabitans sp.]
MLTVNFDVSPRLLELASRVTVQPGGLSAVTAGETYEDDNASSVTRLLGSVLYQTMHNGRDKPLDFAMRSFREVGFERRLLERTPELTREISAPLLEPVGGTSAVALDGLRVRLPEGASIDATAARFPVPCVRPGLSPGFLYMTAPQTLGLGGTTLRVYAHLDEPDRAPELWATAIETLQQLGIHWHAKILSNRALYPRNDALVIYLQRDGWPHARRLAESLQATGVLAPGVSPFTRAITSSVGCAFEPTDQRGPHRGASFGQHRANVLAQALVSHATLPDPDTTPVAESIYAAFLDADIDPVEPARNLSSPAIDVLGIY